MLDALVTLSLETADLEARYAAKLRINPRLNRQLVSFQANKNRPVARWFHYKEGFSEALVGYLLDALHIEAGCILDPFAGTGTTLFGAAERGLNAVGVELLPVGSEIMQVRQLVQGHEPELQAVVRRWQTERPWQRTEPAWKFPHLRITAGAFPDATEDAIARYMTAFVDVPQDAARLLRFALLCVLEEVSYTRKDGQYLRWDHRSGRRQGARPFDKGRILPFDEAIDLKLSEILNDLQPGGGMFDMFAPTAARGTVQVLQGSCLDLLPTLESASFDCIITSPPYANRYDYTRTYALELALLGVDETELRRLRQAMVSCTVENKDKPGLDALFMLDQYRAAVAAFDGQREMQSILAYLEWQKTTKALNNPGIPRMVRNYFFELALIVFDGARLLKPGAPFVMVNDNVRYGGATIPVDLILSDFAERAGFEVEVIWVLPTGKGNSSQQMGTHGREEARKCIYVWRKR